MKSLLASLILLVIATTAIATEPPPSFIRSFGNTGASTHRVQGPSGMVFDAQGHLVLADGAKNRAVLFTADGLYVGEYATGTVTPPRGVALGTDGSIFVCSNNTPFLKRVYAPGGGTWTPAGAPGVSYGITSDPSGMLYMSLTTVGLVKSWNEDGTAGAWTAAPPPGAGPAGLWWADGSVYVACSGDHMIRVYDALGMLVREWGGFGSGPGQLNSPQGVCVNGDAVYVADTQNHRVQKFTRDGLYLTHWGSAGAGNGQFNQPAGVAVAGNGEIFVADFSNNRIQVFGTLPVAATTTTWGRIKTLRK
ncbi:MAG: NHL repeat-containing protein [Candidatus Eisenbacteria bacterium]|nr:NHL repeat-containing protein [Candidatus Eisenbacteria bacterium]